jgi:hypothetical protein
MKVTLGKYRQHRGRKVNVQVDYEDTWGLDHTLAFIILPALIQLQQTKHGVPNDVADVGGNDWGMQDSFDFYKETHDESFNIACDKWDEILNKMIWSFQQIALDSYDSHYHHGQMDISWEPSGEHLNPLSGKQEEFSEMVDKNPEGHWYDSVGHQEHELRIQEGIDLFAKYFRNLWD